MMSNKVLIRFTEFHKTRFDESQVLDDAGKLVDNGDSAVDHLCLDEIDTALNGFCQC